MNTQEASPQAPSNDMQSPHILYEHAHSLKAVITHVFALALMQIHRLNSNPSLT
jgi:hypothetical protein